MRYDTAAPLCTLSSCAIGFYAVTACAQAGRRTPARVHLFYNRVHLLFRDLHEELALLADAAGARERDQRRKDGAHALLLLLGRLEHLLLAALALRDAHIERVPQRARRRGAHHRLGRRPRLGLHHVQPLLRILQRVNMLAGALSVCCEGHMTAKCTETCLRRWMC